MKPSLHVSRRVSTGYQAGALALGLVFFCPSAAAQTAPMVSEKDYLAEVPIVLSVSRLPQRLDETPGSVTILDRDMIRQSGARDIADLLRLVPGFQTSTSFESVAPLASYHGAFDNYSNRIELLIDGRSAYSTYFIGSVGPGLQTVALEDVDRVEVLRGSNSAAYGARAILGVVNIVTRHTVDTIGAQGSLVIGENGVQDVQARLGWGSVGSTSRLTVDQRADDGLTGANGRNRVNRVNFRSDVFLPSGDDFQLRFGAMSIDAGKGVSTDPDNPLRPTVFNSGYAQLDYKHLLGHDAEVSFRLSHSQESYQDEYRYALTNLNPGFGPNDIYTVRFSGAARSDVLTAQHNLRLNDATRIVWGAEYRNEQVQSMALFNTDTPLVNEFVRLFGNVEWRIGKSWLMNSGAMAERSSVNGSTLSPRLMLNWHLSPEQTLRAGVSKAFRPPSAFEKFSDVRYIWDAPAPFGFNFATVQSSGNVQSETVVAKEVGYLANFPKLAISLDARLFEEQIRGFIRQTRSALPTPADYYNSEDFSIRGVEYQATWRPRNGSQFVFSQSFIDIDSTLAGTGTAYAAPKLASTLVYSQKLPGDVSFSLLHQESSEMTLQGSGSDSRFALSRTDMRLAKAFRWGARRGELALVVQNLGVPYRDFDRAFTFDRRAFVALRLQD